jgi:K+-transporting ATPase ATPase A chain
MSYLTRCGLAYHNFASASVGIVLAIAFIRGIARREMQPLAISGSTSCAVICMCCCLLACSELALVSQGVIQNLRPYDTVKLVEPQTIEVDKRMQRAPF